MQLAASVQRKAGADVTLSNGMRIPKGARIVLPTGAIHMDHAFYDDPLRFDPLRFYRKRQANEESRNSHRLVTVGKGDLAWGYGRQACPGRYAADIVMKLLLVEFIMRYDLRCPEGGAAQLRNIEFEGLVSAPLTYVYLTTNLIYTR